MSKKKELKVGGLVLDVAPLEKKESRKVLYGRVQPETFAYFHKLAKEAGLKMGDFFDRLAKSLK